MSETLTCDWPMARCHRGSEATVSIWPVADMRLGKVSESRYVGQLVLRRSSSDLCVVRPPAR